MDQTLREGTVMFDEDDDVDQDEETKDPWRPRPDPYLPFGTGMILMVIAASQVITPLPLSVLVHFGGVGGVAGFLALPRSKVLSGVAAAVLLLGVLALSPPLTSAAWGSWVLRAWLVAIAAMGFVVSAGVLVRRAWGLNGDGSDS
jgi:hypothetical protein